MPILRRLLAVFILVLALWGATVVAVLGSYEMEWLPLRWERSIHAGVRIARAEWSHMDETGKHLPRTRKPRKSTTEPTPESEEAPTATP